MSIFSDLLQSYAEGRGVREFGPGWREKILQTQAQIAGTNAETARTGAQTGEIQARTETINEDLAKTRATAKYLREHGVIDENGEKAMNEAAIQKATARNITADASGREQVNTALPSAEEAQAARAAELKKTTAEAGYYNRMPRDPNGGYGDSGGVSIYNGRYVTPWKNGLLRDVQTGEVFRPLNAASEDKKASLEGMVQDIHTVEEIAGRHLASIGPVQGRFSGVKALFVGNDEETNFIRRTVQNLADQLLRARSGAQINEQEYNRLRALVPNVNSPDKKFLQDVALFRAELERTLALRYGGAPGVNLGAQRVPSPGGGASGLPSGPMDTTDQGPPAGGSLDDFFSKKKR